MARSLKKGPFVDDHLMKKIERDERGQRAQGREDLVAALHDHAGDGRPHPGRLQRQEVHPGLHHREHGRATSSASSRPPGSSRATPPRWRRWPRSAGRRRARRAAPKARGRPCSRSRRHPSTSAPRPRRPGLVMDLIRGKKASGGPLHPALHQEVGGARHREGPALGHRQRGERGRQEPEAAAGRGRPLSPPATPTRGRRRSACARPPWAAPTGSSSAPRTSRCRWRRGSRQSQWVRKSIPSGSAWASTRPGAAAGTPRRTTPTSCTRTSASRRTSRSASPTPACPGWRSSGPPTS